MKSIVLLFFLSSCSFFGIQNEEGPKYRILKKDGDFEIREYEPYIIAKTTVKGTYEEASGKAFKILAGYIFGKNKNDKKIAMTSPVEVKAKNSKKIAMTAPVEMRSEGKSFTMAFSMPSKYTMKDLPRPEDDRVAFEKINSKIVAVHRFTWFLSEKRSEKKALELRKWLEQFKTYKTKKGYTFAGYNPPWTIPFLRRNEVFVELESI